MATKKKKRKSGIISKITPKKKKPAPKKTQAQKTQNKTAPPKKSVATAKPVSKKEEAALDRKALQEQRDKLEAELHKSGTESEKQTATIILFAFGIFLAILVLFPGQSGWRVLHNFIRGLFGVTALLIPAATFWLVYEVNNAFKEKKEIKIGSESAKLFLVVYIVSVFFQTMFGEIKIGSFAENFAATYKDATEGFSIRSIGGALSTLIAYPLVKYLSKVGARIILAILLFASLMIAFRLTLDQLFEFFSHPIKTIDDIIEKQEEKNAPKPGTKDFTEYSDTQEMPAIDVPVNDEPPFDGAKPKKAKVRRHSLNSDNPDDMFNIEIPDEDNITPNDKSDHDHTSPNENAADSLEEMIKQAAAEPETKKLKRQEQADMMLSVNEEFRKRQNSSTDGYKMRALDFLSVGKKNSLDTEELRNKAEILQDTFKSFNVDADIEKITPGPTVIRYEVKPAPGVKVSKITNLADDIALNLAASGVRIEAPIPGKSAIGIEVPNNRRNAVSLRELLETDQFRNSKSKLTFALGKDIAGNPVIGDIAKMPHVIIAGSTGSGKSVCTNSIIMSILYHATPDEVKLILVDPKIVEFQIYDGIPHLLIPVVTDPKKATGALNWAVQEMERRYRVFAETGMRNLADYNNKCRDENRDSEVMPQIVIIIDELADLMMSSSKEVETAICRLAQKARAAGMHLIIATQRPTTDIITGLIKANIPSRIALSVMSYVDSRIILDMGGAEKLLGHGDMLYLPSGMSKPVRVQGCFVSTEEIEKTVTFIRSQTTAEYNSDVMKAVEDNTPSNPAATGSGNVSGDDAELVNEALDIITDMGTASISSLQRKLKLGYARAARIMDTLEEMGVIGPPQGAKPRKVKITKDQVEKYKIR